MSRRSFPWSFGHLCVLSILLSTKVLAQTPQNNVPAAPEDPKALFLQAAKVYGLYSGDLKPWHLKVSYKLLDVSGQPTDQGNIEELWAGPKLRKLVIISATSKLVYLHTEKATYREGELDRKMALLMLLTSAFAQPISYPDKSFSFRDLTLQTRAMGSLQLPCFSLRVHTGSGSFTIPTLSDPTYCLKSNLPIVQTVSFGDDSQQFTLNHTGRFQNRYVPMDIAAGEGDKLDLIAHLDLLEQITNVDPADFKPGPTAVLERTPQTTLVIPEGTSDNHLRAISRPQPAYPASAQAANIHGAVTMSAMIGTDGHIATLHIIKGPEMLRQAALDAVWRWKFEEPYNDGERAQILTVITVRF
jgi:TonB family protein